MTKEYVVFSSEHGMLTKLDHIPGNEIIPKLILKDGNLQRMSPDDGGINLESNNNALPRKTQNIYKLSGPLLNNSWGKKDITKEKNIF